MASSAAGLTLPCAMAQGGDAAHYPAKPIRFILPFAPGGGSDIVGRSVAKQMSLDWGQAVIPENRPGGNSIIGIDIAAKAPPDGYTITLITASATVNVSLMGHKLPFDLMKDLAPVTQMTSQAYVLVVNPKLDVHSMEDLIRTARARPGALTYGSSGIGGITHLAGELLSYLAKIKLLHVPYKGGAPAMVAAISGEIDMGFFSYLQSRPHIEQGQLRPLAVTTSTRSPALPDIPTIAQAGVPGYEVSGWYGLATTSGTPAPVIEKLNTEVARVLKTPDVARMLEADGSTAVGSSVPDFTAYLARETDKWREVIQSAGLAT
jgi:tripartite-type tricarboxylate transporter receptor subunit TctC